MEKRTLTARWLLFLSLLLLVSCGRAKINPEKQPETSTIGAATVVSDPVDIVHALAGLQAKVKRDGDGCIVEVDLRKSSGSEQLWPRLSQLPRLRSLIVAGGKSQAEDLVPLGKIQTLRNLDLRQNSVDAAGLIHLAPLADLRALRLSPDTSLDSAGLDAILNLSQLRVLALDFQWIGAAAELEQLRSLENLEELYLAGTLVDDDAVAVLAQFPRLKKLRIAQTKVSDAGLAHLGGASQLQELDLSENAKITNAGMSHLSGLTQLVRLNLWRVAISDEGISHLAPLVNLQWLNVDNTLLSDDGLQYLSGMQELSYLHLGSTSVTDAGLVHLEPLTALRDLKVTRTGVSAAGASALTEKLPEITIQLKYLENE